MKRTWNFAVRNGKEILRDPISIIFSLLLPLFLLFLFQQFKIPNAAYLIENFTPGIVIFSFSFTTLFSATLIAGDRSTSFLIRLGISPMKPAEYIAGYTLSFLPLLLLQNLLLFALATLLGLPLRWHILWTVLASLVIAVLFLALGLWIGSFVSVKGASGAASIIVQLVCFTSGMYFPKELVGDWFSGLCDWLPFAACLNILKGILQADASLFSLRDFVVFGIYTLAILVAACVTFRHKMTSDNP
ncbi:MAG: ABC transporter permease [Clostridia bacterium]|nr:ABC transporter permease [Clostridia bacterium]